MNKHSIKIEKIGFHWSTESPYLFVAHHQDHYPAGNDQLGPKVSLQGRLMGQDFSGKDGFSMYHGEVVPGFPMHPHRGFETVTVVTQGLVDHFDSKGSCGRYGNGDVQWLTTGKGCQHAEMFPLVHKDRDNPLELFQIWLNLPSKDKMVEPHYKMLWAEDIPKVNFEGGSVDVIAGSFSDTLSLDPSPDSYAMDRAHQVGIFLIKLEAKGTVVLPKRTEKTKRNLYFFQGTDTLSIDGEKVESSHRVKLAGDEEILLENGNAQSFLLILEGEPIDEPVEQYGPFVMNSESEIQKAFEDYQETEFGGWPWERPDQVNAGTQGRFARYADGRVENR
ncbi:pirin family protein [uncultured Sphaerochaeta sp.]|uniref:pirin family protein n=1 Tax=uncultured Sphaerochaeta sp. TaxID=886478 RepID=UPI002A0A7B8A|nr:pirin family protein [uncultured Sphaerochaeta sp.]